MGDIAHRSVVHGGMMRMEECCAWRSVAHRGGVAHWGGGVHGGVCNGGMTYGGYFIPTTWVNFAGASIKVTYSAVCSHRSQAYMKTNLCAMFMLQKSEPQLWLPMHLVDFPPWRWKCRISYH